MWRSAVWFLLGMLPLAAVALGASPAAADPAAFGSGAPVYPPPFLAVARTAHRIPPIPTVLNIQIEHGSLAGFGGFVDAATGQVGFPGNRNDAPLRFAFDDEKLGVHISFPYPFGRAIRSDDVFELLIEPRDSAGKPRGPVYRLVGNFAGECRVDQDLPAVGQRHQPWAPVFRYGTMMWEPSQSWLAGIQIAFAELGGPPAPGDSWGVQCALRYADPAITAVLSPAATVTDTARFARLRFDPERRANYIGHWLAENELKQGVLSVGAITSNSGSDPARLRQQVRAFKGDRELGRAERTLEVKGLETYQLHPQLRLAVPEIATAAERDTVARVMVIDQSSDKVIYDQHLPFWRPPPDERDWLKQHFAREFTFQIGAYPSHGVLDYAVDCRTLREANPAARTLELVVNRNGAELLRESKALAAAGILNGQLKIGPMPNAARYEVIGVILDAAGAEISRKTETLQRAVRPFETAPRAGRSDVVVPPFTAPVVGRGNVAVWGRTYRHGRRGLLEGLRAADEDLLARPARFMANGEPLRGGGVELRKQGAGRVAYTQRFSGAGVKLDVTGELDYDGFYKFRVTIHDVSEGRGSRGRPSTSSGSRDSPSSPPPVEGERPRKPLSGLTDLYLEIPLQANHALLYDTPVDWVWKASEQTTGLLPTRPGRLWDSKNFPYADRDRAGNMPPYIWVGDDERGLMYSCASDEGMQNVDDRPAATLDREGDEVVLRVWFAQKPAAQSAQPAPAGNAAQPQPNQMSFRACEESPTSGAEEPRDSSQARNDRSMGWRRSRRENVDFTDTDSNPSQVGKPASRTFAFALQASPFKAMPEHWRLWRNASRQDVVLGAYQARGRFFHTGWGVGYYYPAYGRFIDLEKNKASLDKARGEGFDSIPAPGSSCSESGCTPEYLEFWREWGSPLGFADLGIGPIPERARGIPELADARCFTDAISNNSASNLDYRLWWLEQVVRHCGVEFIYQDNAPYDFHDQPVVGYGYQRADGKREPTSATWNAREFMKRVAHMMIENGVTNSPNVWANLCGVAQPGRSFCRKGLTGESLESDQITLGAFRVWFSKQWGIVTDWLMQAPNAGASARYWRALGSRLLLHDCTNFSRWDSIDMARRWLVALDLFWLDDPAVVWHPYYQNPTVRTTTQPTTLVSTYRKPGRGLFVISNQATNDLVETVQLATPELRHFYDAETGEVIERDKAGAVRVFLPGRDYRLVLGFAEAAPAVAVPAGVPAVPAQSTVDARGTVTAMAQQLLVSPRLAEVPNGHRLSEAWLAAGLAEMHAAPVPPTYRDAQACADVDLGDPALRCAILIDKPRQVMLVSYYNPTDTPRLLNGNVREAVRRKAEIAGSPYVLDPITGIGQLEHLDLPARSGKIEVFYPDSQDYWGRRHGPFKIGTMLSHHVETIGAERAVEGKAK